MFGECLFDGGRGVRECLATESTAAVPGTQGTAASGARVFRIVVGMDLDGITAEGESFEGMVHDGLQKRETAPTGKVSRGKEKPAGAGSEFYGCLPDSDTACFVCNSSCRCFRMSWARSNSGNASLPDRAAKTSRRYCMQRHADCR